MPGTASDVHDAHTVHIGGRVRGEISLGNDPQLPTSALARAGARQ